MYGIDVCWCCQRMTTVTFSCAAVWPTPRHGASMAWRLQRRLKNFGLRGIAMVSVNGFCHFLLLACSSGLGRQRHGHAVRLAGRTATMAAACAVTCSSLACREQAPAAPRHTSAFDLPFFSLRMRLLPATCCRQRLACLWCLRCSRHLHAHGDLILKNSIPRAHDALLPVRRTALMPRAADSLAAFYL